MYELKNLYILKGKRQELRHRMTPAEKILWQRLRTRRLDGIRFTRQFSIGYYILDFYSPKLRLAIEVDGRWHARPEVVQCDRRRTRFLEEEGVVVIRFWNWEVIERCDEVVERIRGVVGEISRECGGGGRW